MTDVAATDIVEVGLSNWRTDSWDEVVALFVEHSACWADDAGLHVTVGTALPDHPLRYCSHLWGWGDGTLLRVRVDQGRYWVAVITLSGAGESVVRCRLETGLRMWSGTGESATIRLADDTEPSVLGARARAYTVLDTEAGGMAFLALEPEDHRA